MSVPLFNKTVTYSEKDKKIFIDYSRVIDGVQTRVLFRHHMDVPDIPDTSYDDSYLLVLLSKYYNHFFDLFSTTPLLLEANAELDERMRLSKEAATLVVKSKMF
jgi:hypothetical protein